MDGSNYQVAGFFTQAYNQIVVPERVWGATRYFIRRWGPRLGPTRFWTVIAARQLAYRNARQDWFDAYNEEFAAEAHLSKAHMKRIKEEMGHTDDLLSLYLSKEDIRYEVIDGRPRPRPTTYHIRLDDLLTPEDANQLANWLRQRKQGSDPVDVVRLLNRAADTPRTDLLAAPLAFPNDTNHSQPITTLSVVKAVWNKTVATNSRVKATAEMLQQYLIGAPIYGTQYFRQRWLDILGAGPAFLMIYLRSLCFVSEQAGEMRDTVTFTRPELATHLGVTSKTLTNWLDTIDSVVPPQALPPFLHLLESKRTPQNEVEYTYQVALVDPLVPEDITPYDQLLQKAVGEGVMEKMSLTNRPLMGKMSFTPKPSLTPPQRKNEPDADGGDGRNEPHVRGERSESTTSMAVSPPAGMAEKMSRGQRRNEPGLEKKRDGIPYYYNMLLIPLNTFDLSFLQHDDWHLSDGLAQEPVAAAVGGVSGILHRLGIAPDDPLSCLDDGAYELVVGWYVYALSQPEPHSAEWVVHRIRSRMLPPQVWIDLAWLSWELWRCYACLTQLPESYRVPFQECPAFTFWMATYSNKALETLPFGVGAGLPDLLSPIEVRPTGQDVQTPEPGQTPSKRQSDLWQTVLDEIRLTLPKATFNQHLAGARLVSVQDAVWVIGVRNPRSVAWIENRLARNIQDHLTWIFRDETDNPEAVIAIRYVALDAWTG